MKKLIQIFISLAFALGQVPAIAQTKVLQFDLKEEINPAAWRATRKAFDLAKQTKADVIIINMNTYGGQLDYADSIRTKILNSDIKTIVFIDNNAASA